MSGCCYGSVQIVVSLAVGRVLTRLTRLCKLLLVGLPNQALCLLTGLPCCAWPVHWRCLCVQHSYTFHGFGALLLLGVGLVAQVLGSRACQDCGDSCQQQGTLGIAAATACRRHKGDQPPAACRCKLAQCFVCMIETALRVWVCGFLLVPCSCSVLKLLPPGCVQLIARPLCLLLLLPTTNKWHSTWPAEMWWCISVRGAHRIIARCCHLPVVGCGV